MKREGGERGAETDIEEERWKTGECVFVGLGCSEAADGALHFACTPIAIFLP